MNETSVLSDLSDARDLLWNVVELLANKDGAVCKHVRKQAMDCILIILGDHDLPASEHNEN